MINLKNISKIDKLVLGLASIVVLLVIGGIIGFCTTHPYRCETVRVIEIGMCYADKCSVQFSDDTFGYAKLPMVNQPINKNCSRMKD